MKAAPGDTVVVIYDGTTENGELFDSSEASGPLEFTLGTGSVLPGFEENITGMTPGETKSFTLPPEAAHGLSKPELIHTIKRDGIKGHESVQIGMVLGLTMEHNSQQHQVPATVTAMDKQNITVDFNHPMAGQTLTYKVTLQSVVKNTPVEQQTGFSMTP
jgi:peptidylprolyl isomerase